MLHTIFSKLDKRLFRPLCVAVASVVLAFSCIVPAQAVDPVSIAGLAISGVSLAKDVIQTYLDDSASNTEKQAALQGYKDHWISKDNISDKCFLTYDALCQIVIDLNNAGQPAKISSVTLGSNNVEYYVVKACGPFGYTSVQSQFGFGATSIWNNYGLFYSTSNRVLFCAQVNTDLSLDSCLTQLRLIQTNVVTIKNSLVNTIGSNLESLLTTCNTISAKLDTLTSVISNGKVLVDNSDVVSAIQSIPAFDDAELLSGLSALGATATRIADAIDYNFGQYSGTHTFPSLDKRQFYVYGDKAELFKDISGQVLYSSSERLSTFSYTRDYDGMTRTLYVRALPTSAQYTLELLSDTRPTAPITISKIEYRTLLGGARYRDSIVYPVAWRYSSVANKYYAVTGFTVYYKDDPEQYPVSTSASAFENPYVYGFDSKPVDVVFSSRFTAFQQLENTRLINALSGRDYTSQLTAVIGRMDDILAQLQSTSGSATCEHTYSQHMEQEATCILPGLMISTCSKCGDSSSEIVDPLGHDWQCTSHVDAVTDPDTGEETSSAYDIYTCSRCGDTYEDHTGTGAPDEDYSNTTISQLVVKVFSKLGTFAGKLLGSVVHLFDKAVNAVDDLASKFNDYVEQIKGFGENYPIWLSGFWGIIPAELQVALTFAVICMALGVVGKKLFFS